MWVVPKNLKMSSAFAADTVESKEDLALLESTIESSLAWKSKHTSLQTWCKKWSRIKWLPHLFGRTLKPSQERDFEEKWTSSLEDIHANHSLLPDTNSEQKTQDTFGLLSCDKLKQLDLFNAFSRTSKDTLIEDFSKSSQIWMEQVTIQRGEYSQRQKLAHLTEEREYLSWPTPTARDHKGGYIGGRIRNGKVSFDTLDVAVQHISNKDKKSGTLNPNWVEWLMGLPIGWTDLGSWGTE